MFLEVCLGTIYWSTSTRLGKLELSYMFLEVCLGTIYWSTSTRLGPVTHTRETRASFTIPKYKVSVIIEGKPNQLYAQGMRSFEQYDEIYKYFAEGYKRTTMLMRFRNIYNYIM